MSNGNSYSFSLPKSTPSIIISDYSCSEPPEPFCIDIEDVEVDGSEQESTEDPTFADKENRLTGKLPMNTTMVEKEAMTPPPSVIPTVSAPRAKRGNAPIISNALLRRSKRVHNNTKGFKSPSCKDRGCLGCSSDPPTLSACIVRDLGASVYKLDPASLTEESLNAKPPKKKLVSKPKAKKAKKDGAYVDGDGPSTSKKKK